MSKDRTMYGFFEDMFTPMEGRDVRTQLSIDLDGLFALELELREPTTSRKRKREIAKFFRKLHKQNEAFKADNERLEKRKRDQDLGRPGLPPEATAVVGSDEITKAELAYKATRVKEDVKIQAEIKNVERWALLRSDPKQKNLAKVEIEKAMVVLEQVRNEADDRLAPLMALADKARDTALNGRLAEMQPLLDGLDRDVIEAAVGLVRVCRGAWTLRGRMKSLMSGTSLTTTATPLDTRILRTLAVVLNEPSRSKYEQFIETLRMRSGYDDTE